MMMRSWLMRTFVQLVALGMMTRRSSSLTPSEMSSLYTTIFTNYDSRLLPVLEQNAVATVGITFGVFSINEFDELSGIISLSVSINYSWKEERISWNPADYENRSSIAVRPGDIWHPNVYLFQATDQIEDIANSSIMPRLQYDGQVIWNTGRVLHAICSLDVTYFPFDTQYCNLILGTNAYLSSELLLVALDPWVGSTFLSPNSQWKLLESSSLQTGSVDTADSLVRVTLYLERRVKFYVVYIIVPTIFLSVLNIMVFVMPKDSGERLSVATTMFLSFVVYMDIVNNNVPESSDPMSYFYFYLLYLMIYSSMIMFLCVISLRIYSKTSEVPRMIQVFIRWTKRLHSCSKPTIKVEPNRKDQNQFLERDITVHVDEFDKEKMEQNPDEVGNNLVPEDCGGNVPPECERPVLWDDVGRVFDAWCLLLLGFLHVLFSSVSLYSIVNRE